MFNRHYEAKRQLLHEALNQFPFSEIKDLIVHRQGGFDAYYGTDQKIVAKVSFLYDRIKSGKHPFSQADGQRILNEIKEFLSFPPLLTAPKRNPNMPELYR